MKQNPGESFKATIFKGEGVLFSDNVCQIVNIKPVALAWFGADACGPRRNTSQVLVVALYISFRLFCVKKLQQLK